MTQKTLAGIVLALAGAVTVLFPKTVWKYTERWKYPGVDEPTALWYTVSRAVSAAAILVGVLLIAGILS